jgi:iron complex outermembrane receptor protein
MLYPSRVGPAIIIALLSADLAVFAQDRKPSDTTKSLLLKEVIINRKTGMDASNTRKITRKELALIQSRTLGETLSHIPGIQNSYFGPNSGTPVIRSLSGNRVKVLSNGISMNDLSGISPNLNLGIDMDNLLGIDVHKSDGGVLYGGKAIGGAVNLRDNTIPTARVSKKIAGFVTAEGGTNSGFKQAFDLNGNLGKRWVWHLGAMNQSNGNIKIPGNTKAPIAYDPTIDVLTQTMAQVNVEREITRNLTLYPFLSQFVLENLGNPEWGLSESDLYTFQANSVIGGQVVPNPKNTVYVPGQPPGTPTSTIIVKGITDYAPVTKGIMPNSHSNSHAMNVGTSYVGDKFSAGLGYRRSYGYYGIPGFALRKLPGHVHSHDAGDAHVAAAETTYLPINTRSASNSLMSAFNYRPEEIGIASVRLNYMTQFYEDSELTGRYLSNKFNTQRNAARLEVEQESLTFLKGLSGLDFSFMKMSGRGTQRYLPDNLSREFGVFTLQQISFKPVHVDLGYRHDAVNRRAFTSIGYAPGRGLGGGKLSARDFQLDHFNTSVQLDLSTIAFIKASYSHSERAPDVNELYSGNNHLAIMLEENGDDRLNKEIARTVEYGAGLNMGGLQLTLSYYQTKFNNYMYLAHTGISRSGGFLVKEWRQANTKIAGWEAEIGYHNALAKQVRLDLMAYFDLVKNSNDSEDHLRDWAEGDYMPNMPTSRYGLSGALTVKKIALKILFDRYLEQRYLGKNINPEPPMPPYSLLAARFSYSHDFKGFNVKYFASGDNLLNVEARPQNSFLKYLAPLPGTNISIGLSVGI